MDAKTAATSPSGRSALRLAMVALLLGTGGASCPRMVEQYRLPVSPVLTQQATLDQVAMLVNENSSRIQSISATSAKISSSEFPTLKASLAVERPQRLRLLAEATSLTGGEFDLGSNDELFWFWVKRNSPPALYYCRHEQFDSSALRGVVPIEPDWLIEALGIVTFDASEEHQGPFHVGRNRLEIRTIVRRPTSSFTKVRVIDANRGWIVAQHIYDSSGQRLASALASGHRRDPLSQAIVPRHVEIQWPLSDFSLKIDLGQIAINTVPIDNAQLWTKPVYEGWPDVDLAQARVIVGANGQPVITPGAVAPPSFEASGIEPAREARTPAAEQPNPKQSSAVEAPASPLADPSGSTMAQTGRISLAASRHHSSSDVERARPERRVIPDYAAEPVIWR